MCSRKSFNRRDVLSGDFFHFRFGNLSSVVFHPVLFAVKVFAEFMVTCAEGELAASVVIDVHLAHVWFWFRFLTIAFLLDSLYMIIDLGELPGIILNCISLLLSCRPLFTSNITTETVSSRVLGLFLGHVFPLYLNEIREGTFLGADVWWH